jgi:hypothetical protein
MLDYQRIVDDVRSSMFSNSVEGVDFLRGAAADYSVACDEINERLRRCGALLRQGLRSEAIHLAEIEPNLLDVVATLDFPERGQWEQVVSHYGIVPPVPLLLDVAADLNEAYAIEQPLAELLKHHRLLALAHAPLTHRVNTLRSLVQADGHNPVWIEDLQIFETERLKELQHEVADAAEAGDLMTLASLDDELRSDGWSSMPSASLVRWTGQAREKLEDRDTRANLERIATGLHDAFAALDADWGRHWRGHWNDAAKPIAWTEDEPAFQMAGSALDWLAEQDALEARQTEHDAAVAKLRSALLAKAPSDELRRHHKAAVANAFRLTDDLEASYRKRLDELARTAKRTRIAIISGAAVAMAIAAAVIWIVAANYLFNARVVREKDTLATLLGDNDLDAAQKEVARVNDHDPDVAASEPIRALIGELQKKLQAETDRHQAFEGFLKAATAHGLDHLDIEALNEATKRLKTDSEKIELRKVKDEINAGERSTAEKSDAAYVLGLAPFRAKLKELQQQVEADYRQASNVVDRFQEKFKAFDEESGASFSAKAQGDNVRDGISSLQSLIARRRDEDAVLVEITAAVGDSETFQGALTKFVQRFPDEARTADLKRALDNAPLWATVARWNELLRDLARVDVTRLSPTEAKDVFAKAKPLIEKDSEYPDAAAVRERLDHLDSITHRVDPNQQRIEEPLKKLFSDPLVADLWMLQLPNGERLYLKDDPKLPAAGMRAVECIVGFDLVEKKRGVDPAKLAFNGPSPQVQLAKKVRPLLKDLKNDNWERTFFLIVKTIDDAKDIDAILKLNLLRQTLEVGCQGSSIFDHAFAKHLDALKEQNVNPFANWLDSKDEAAKADRHRAETALAALPSVAAAGKATADEVSRLHRPPGSVRRWIGWLRHGPADNWRCEPSSLGNLAGELLVVRQGLGNAVSFEGVGSIKDGIATIVIPAGGTPPEGSPLYLVAPEKR